MSTTQTGVVKWFNDGKGFGFITPEDGSKDLFAHFSEIRNNGGFRSLAENQRVEFEVKQGPKGLQAANIRPLYAGPGRHRRPDLTGRSCRLTNKKTAPVKVALQVMQVLLLLLLMLMLNVTPHFLLQACARGHAARKQVKTRHMCSRSPHLLASYHSLITR